MQPMSGQPSGRAQPRLVAADGMAIVSPGVVPKAGGLPGKAARGQDGSRRCCTCFNPIPADRGKSPYCESCKKAAEKAAAKARDAKHVDAAAVKSAVIGSEHWVGPGYIYGKDGSLILDAKTVHALRDEFGGALALLTEYGPLADRGYDARNGEHYHRVLGEVLEQVENLNLTLRHALWPKGSGRRPPNDGAQL